MVRGGSIGFERVPVDGSSKIDDTLMESLEPYNFKDAVDYEKKAYGALLIYDNQADWFSYKLTAADKKALKDFE